MTAIEIAQHGAAAAWAAVAVGTLWPTIRLAVGLGTAPDADAAREFAMALLMLGFFVRWLIWSATMKSMTEPELSFWLALYTFSILLGGWTLAARVARQGWRPWRD